jgi:hypothetical protein
LEALSLDVVSFDFFRSWEVSEQKLESSLREWDNLFVSISCEQEHVNLVLLVSITILDKEEEEILLLLSP